jgi:signal transduction histidine kinase
LRRSGGSISLRLAVGFMLVLAVFGAALLVTLYNLNRVRSANEQVRVRQEIRRQTVEVGRLAEQLLACQQEFIESAGVDWAKVAEFTDLYRRMEEGLKSLSLQDPEARYAEDLNRATPRLRSIFLDQVLPAKLQMDMGVTPQMSLEALQEQTRGVLRQVSDANERLAHALDVRTTDAQFLATQAWALSLAVAKSIFPMALLMSLLIIYYTHRSIVRPVGSLLAGTKALAGGKLSSRIEVEDSGEFTALAESFNRMASALEANQKQLVEAEKMAGVGRLAAGVAHEINNPMAVILGYGQMLLSHLPPDSSQAEQVRTIVQEARQCKQIVDGLLDLSRPSDPTAGEVVNPNDVVAEVLNTVQVLQLTDNVTVDDSVIDRPLPLTISGARLRQLTLNIVRNALEAVHGAQGASLQIEGYVRPRTKIEQELLKDASPESQSFLILVFTDNGPGIAPEHLKRLFEPFFTTKATGMGLGLAISYNIAAAHGGFIHVQSALAKGTAFAIGLPLSGPA